MDKPKGKRVHELEFAEEIVEGQVTFDLRADNIYVHIAEKDEKVGGITIPHSAAQRTRFGKVMAVGPQVNIGEDGEPVPDHDRVEVGDIVAIQFHVGSWLNAPAFGFRDQSHVICKANAIMFTLRDK